MKRTFFAAALAALFGAGCATISPLPLTDDDPANPEAPEAEQSARGRPLLAGSEPLAQWLATNRVDAVHDNHSHHEHGDTPAAKPSPNPADREHRHE